MHTRRPILIFLITLALLFSSPATAPARGQTATPSTPADPADLDARIEAILAELSVEERVGQLFVVSFVGQFATPADAIAELIRDYKIGGVVLLEVNNNVDNQAEDTPAQVANLVNQLQTRAHEATFHPSAQGSNQPTNGFFLPLFVAIDHEGDGYPRAHLRNGFTPIPSAMALGATWRPQDVEAVGAIVGQELAAVGINMLLGPVVDVLGKPHPEGSGDINIRAFGGSPFWVGQLGRAYVRGVHQGGGGRVLTVAKHFPGHGTSDRSPDYEVATVHKSLDELRQSDLVPFFAVTRAEPDDPLSVTDGMMPSHIRYRGFQGDVDQLTRPISLDPEGMEAFMALSPLAEWREEGLIVCDSLGVRAIKGYYDPTFQSFPAKQIAKEALLAGNDVLPLVSFAPAATPGWFEGQRPTIEETITFFQEQYEEDEAFRRRVDEAVRKILRAKLRLYPELALDDVLVTGETAVGRGDRAVAEVARKTLTLLHPPAEDLARRLPAPPRPDEQILILGCFEGCLATTRLQGETVRDALLELYGPRGSGLIAPEQVQTVNFADLYRLMTGEAEPQSDLPAEEQLAKSREIVERIRNADWLVLVLINYIPDNYPESGTAKLFLRDPTVTIDGEQIRFDLRDTKVVALALHAPYYLDATEIGKLSAYYAVYSKVAPSLEVALRALFQEATPVSAPPVSVDGIGYDLETALRPDPDQTLALMVQPNRDEVWRVGEAVRVRAGPLLDHNGHPVPDDTRVLFQGDYADLGIRLPPRQVTGTIDGLAWALFEPTLAGRLEISASTDGVASESVGLLINATAASTEPAATVAASATTTAPEVTATSPPPTATATPTTTTPATPTPTGTPASPAAGPTSPSTMTVALILAGLLLIGGPLTFLWYRNRSAPLKTSPPPEADEADATATVSADLAALAPAMTGRTLGSCRVGQKLGGGGMGQVYKGYHPLLDRSVAIKILPPTLVDSDEMRARFLQEARIAAALRHPNIVQIYDFGQDENLIYMTMEYIEGSSLKERLSELREQEEIMPVAEAVEIARQIAGALTYAHDHGAVHRDLKPANILLNPQGQAILVDFGLAVLRDGPRYTEPGKVWGSPTYIAPEQLDVSELESNDVREPGSNDVREPGSNDVREPGSNDESPRAEVDARSDIYALGVILYEMVAGRPPYRASSAMEILWQKTNVDPRPPRELVPELPPSLEALILKALARQPAERYQTAQELAAALSELEVQQ